MLNKWMDGWVVGWMNSSIYLNQSISLAEHLYLFEIGCYKTFHILISKIIPVFQLKKKRIEFSGVSNSLNSTRMYIYNIEGGWVLFLSITKVLRDVYVAVN